ncbi:MAG: DoxX family protein [Pirellulales bacterium]
MNRLLNLDAAGWRVSLGMLAVRVVVGAAFVFHGWPKIQNPMEWMGPDAPVPGILQAVAAVSEFVGGMALVAGLLTPLAALCLAGTMIGALSYHLNSGDPFVPGPQGGPSWELAATYLAVAVAVLLIGPGRASVDALLFGRPRNYQQAD